MNKYIVVVGFGVIIMVAILFFRPQTDPAVDITLTAAFVMQILNFISSRENSDKIKVTTEKVEETRHAMNSLLDARVASANKEGHADGFKEGRDSANERTDKLTQQAQDNKGE